MNLEFYRPTTNRHRNCDSELDVLEISISPEGRNQHAPLHGKVPEEVDLRRMDEKLRVEVVVREPFSIVSDICLWGDGEETPKIPGEEVGREERGFMQLDAARNHPVVGLRVEDLGDPAYEHGAVVRKSMLRIEQGRHVEIRGNACFCELAIRRPYAVRLGVGQRNVDVCQRKVEAAVVDSPVEREEFVLRDFARDGLDG